MGNIIDMLQVRYEELQIGWACSAQNPDLLPDSIKKAGRKSAKEKLRARAEKHFGA